MQGNLKARLECMEQLMLKNIQQTLGEPYRKGKQTAGDRTPNQPTWEPSAKEKDLADASYVFVQARGARDTFAEQGLLQSEIDNDDQQNVGFYGKCMPHARNSYLLPDSQPVNSEVSIPGIKERSCARTEGFRGRKISFFPNYQNPFNDEDGCTVSQVLINAWLHINGHKSCTRSGTKLACSDVEHDLRKEYIRYKLSEGWKHLVVYNSGIHDLGLYTSQFITRGAMVVEYVGEIVGLRVADKRELEYLSGRRLQCKTACYFFRIDKDHIVDATRKGGIARFVNHSCLPNCIAKIISIRSEKKVVFFAERDINPGEEITYDYHFSREDEGKKIPCLCNSKNCRRYLN